MKKEREGRRGRSERRARAPAGLAVGLEIWAGVHLSGGDVGCVVCLLARVSVTVGVPALDWGVPWFP